MLDHGVHGSDNHTFFTSRLFACFTARAPSSCLLKSQPVSKVRRSAWKPNASAQSVTELLGLQQSSQTNRPRPEGSARPQVRDAVVVVWPSLSPELDTLDKVWPLLSPGLEELSALESSSLVAVLHDEVWPSLSPEPETLDEVWPSSPLDASRVSSEEESESPSRIGRTNSCKLQRNKASG